MTQRIRVAVAGGGIGKAHMVAYAKLTDLFDVRYICDLNDQKAREAAELIPGCGVTGDINEVLADPEVDLFDNCLPPHLHAPMSIAALEAGKHVICEKPIAGSLLDVDRMAEAAARSGRQVFPVFQYRYGPGYRAAHELKTRGLLGKPYVISLETHWQRGPDYYAEPWRGTWKGELGGAIVSHACHIHNLTTHLAGDITEVAVFLDTRVNPIESEDCAAITMRTAEGALVTSSLTLGAAGNSSRFRACFEHVMMTSSTEAYRIGGGDWRFEATDPARQAEIDAIVAGFSDGLERFSGMFTEIHARLNGKPDIFLPSMEEGRHSIELMAALYDSARNGRVVRLPLAADHPLHQGWLAA
jgi:predicted dehydrogenase